MLLLISIGMSSFAEGDKQGLRGKVVDESGVPLVGATIYIEGTKIGATTNMAGEFQLPANATKSSNVVFSYVGYYTKVLPFANLSGKNVEVQLTLNSESLDEVEVFGSRTKQPDKMDYITRLPLRPSEQIQSISVVSDKMIAQQGTLTLSDATRNVVGVSTFATYGNANQSLSARGFRGIPTLKNGVRVHSDFRGQGFITDMQGVETIQVIKGSAAVTQGIGNDLGSAAGVINIATKTPHFTNEGNIELRVGSWGLVRPTFDLQRTIDRQNSIAFRINGALERSDSYRVNVDKDRIYINPSIAWKPTNKTTLILEMDYLHDSRTPDRGTVNLAADSVNALYHMPNNKFIGFKTDRVFNNNLTWTARINHQLSNQYSLRVAVASSQLDIDNTGASTVTLGNVSKTGLYNLRQRSLGRSIRNDANKTLQVDFVGQDVYTGKIKHTFQVGIDYKYNTVSSTSYTSKLIDTVDVLKPISNTLPGAIQLTAQSPTTSTEYSYGVVAQNVTTYNKYLKSVLGVRYSYGNSLSNVSSGATTGDTWNPMAGLIFTPFQGFNLFGSYTNTTDLRSAANLMEDGTPVGASTTEQFEVGIKSDWFDNRLRFNLTLFHINTANLTYTIYNSSGQSTDRFGKAGDLKRKGIETELTGRLLDNLQLILGYAYLDAQYKNSLAYVDGSAPMNAPKHTANGWIYYTIANGTLKGLSIGAGAYYVGERPVGEYTVKFLHANTVPGVKPFDMDAYTTVNANLAYAYQRFGFNLALNNIFNSTGYSSYYRGGFINPTDPLNASFSISYKL